jgi:betaine-aldehyde dehydrogenase
MMLIKKMFINGQWVEATSGKTRKIINPYNSEIIAIVAEGGREDSQKAIMAARSAFDFGEWKYFSPDQRSKLLYKFADIIENHKLDLATLETLNTGKTLEESLWDMGDVSGIFRYYAELCDKSLVEVLHSPRPHSSSQILREPIGVCGQISPWNYPLLQASWKLAPALAAGCTVVIKPSELTPLTSIKLVELCAEIDFPPGVINLVLGEGGTVGAELSESNQVDMISFTGGITTGKQIMKAATSNVKKIALELGGKNPHILFADADLDTAFDFVLNGVFFHAGQICSAGSRVLVEASIHDKLVEWLHEKILLIRLGNGLDEGTQMGPLISEAHRAKVEEYVKIGIQEGAKLICGGSRPQDSKLENGFFYLPTLFVDCHESMKIVREEIFGPVITIEKFETEDEVIRKANDTDYGLSAGFWTSNTDRIQRISKSLRFGTVWINDFNVYFPQAPWGGFKQSGIGRELGVLGLEEYQEVKHVFQNHQNQPIKWFTK